MLTTGSCRRGTRRRPGRGRTSRRRTAPASRSQTAADSPPSLPPHSSIDRRAKTKRTTRGSAASFRFRGEASRKGGGGVGCVALLEPGRVRDELT